MPVGTNIHTYFEGAWHEGDVPIIRAADHGAWLGSSVFDGARFFDGVCPDLEAHCARVNASAKALMITPTVSVPKMMDIVREGLKRYPNDAAIYIRPMYWAIDGDAAVIVPSGDRTGFSICLEQVPFAPVDATVRLGLTRFRRPVLENAVVNAKAGCLYPNNARMLAEVRANGFQNALVADALGKRGRKRHLQRLHGPRRRGAHTGSQWHVSGRYHPCPAYRQPRARKALKCVRPS